MLPEYIDQNEPHRFATNDSGGLYVYFFRFDPKDGANPLARHWMRECANQFSRRAMLRWLGARLAHWQDWGRLAETIGEGAFALHIEHLMTADPIREVLATSVQELPDPRALSFGELLGGHPGLQTETLYVHRFATPDLSVRFLDWFVADLTGEGSDKMLKIAYGQGTAALGAFMDKMALSTRAKRGRERRLGQATRSRVFEDDPEDAALPKEFRRLQFRLPELQRLYLLG